jgi:predicted permease
MGSTTLPLMLPAHLRHALASMRRRPGAAATAVLVVAIGVGLSTAMFAVTDPYILRPLPYAAPHELVSITVRPGGVTRDAAIPTFEEWRRRTDLFQGLAATGSSTSLHRLRLADRGAIALTLPVSADLFDVLGLRVDASADWRVAASGPVPVLLADRLLDTPAARLYWTWRIPEGMASIGDVIPQQDGPGLRVAGRLPEGFLIPEASPRWVSGVTHFEPGAVIRVNRWRDDGRPVSASSPGMIARLQPGVTPDRVRETLAVMLPSGRPLNVVVTPLHEALTGRMRSLAWGALGAALLVLIVCAGNLANLWLAATAHREREMATRAALGATRRDLIGLWLAEGVIVASIAGGFGLAVAAIVLAAAARVIPEGYATFGNPAMTSRTMVAGVLAAIAVTAMALLPVLVRAGRAPVALLDRRHERDGRRDRVLRLGFVGLQAAFTVILAVAAGMLGRSYVNLVTQDPGFDEDVVAIVSLHDSPSPEMGALASREVTALRQLPGVTGVAAVGNAAVGSLATYSSTAVDVAGVSHEAKFQPVTGSFFEVAGMTIVQGRALGGGDQDTGAVVVNETLARLAWAGTSAIGQAAGDGRTVVGIVKDAYERRYDDRPEPTVYEFSSTAKAPGVTYLLQTATTPAALIDAASRTLASARADAIVVDIATLGDRLAWTVRDRSFATLMIALFAVAAGTIALAGLIGVVAFVVTRRSREIAIRMAIGARPAHVRRLVALHTIIAAAAGAAFGLVIGRWLSTGLGSLLYGIEPGDGPTTLAAGAVTIGLMLTAALATAERAVRMQPTRALRIE